MPHVVVELELPVVDPHGVILQGDPSEPLAVARYQVHHRLGGPLDRRYVDTPVAGRERARFEDLRGGHVHVGAGSLCDQKGVVLGGKPLVAVTCHGIIKPTAAVLSRGATYLMAGASESGLAVMTPKPHAPACAQAVRTSWGTSAENFLKFSTNIAATLRACASYA